MRFLRSRGMALCLAVATASIASPAHAELDERQKSQTEIIFAIAGLGDQPVMGAVYPGEIGGQVVVTYARKTKSGWVRKGQEKVAMALRSDLDPDITLFETYFKQAKGDGKCRLTARFLGTETIAPSAHRVSYACSSGYTY